MEVSRPIAEDIEEGYKSIMRSTEMTSCETSKKNGRGPAHPTGIAAVSC
jgi:hypothetical protein